MATSDTPTFPIRPVNRPALPRISYRLGAYPDIVDAMFRRINASIELERWTHRAPDDPGVAIVESAAIVADILTFYQEHYANEAFLRTAGWRESIQELVRLTGYRLAPGIGGRTFFALEFRGDRPVTVPAAFPLKAELEDGAEPVDFQTVAEHEGLPHLSAFNLYRARTYSGGIPAGARVLDVAKVDNSADPAKLDGLDLKAGDKVMLVPAEPGWTRSGTPSPAQATPQVVKVRKVTHRLGRCIVEIEDPVNHSWSGNVTAYRIGRTFRHFGHNAPPKRHVSIKSGSEVTGTREYDTDFTRHLDHECSQPDTTVSLPPRFVPLDQELGDIVPGARLIIQSPVAFGSTVRSLTLVRDIDRVSAGPIGVGDMNGSATFLTLDASMVTNDINGRPSVDLREMRFVEVTGPKLELTRQPTHPSGAFTNTNQLHFHGTADDAAELVDRLLMFKAADGRFDSTTVVHADLASPAWVRLRQITLDHAPAGFTRADFREDTPVVTIYGNVVEATQGRAEAVVALGNGDARQVFQTFKIPKAPLTFLHDAASTPTYAPELTIRVAGREWTRVDSFFGRGRLEEIYIVRDDADGKSYVQFGDGENGARLPSGVHNVTAGYRTATGALGPVKAGTKPSAGAKLDGLDKVHLPGEVTGGAPGEDSEKAREAAPGKLQTLGRLVSLKDYESEALGTAGVVAAAAAWDIADGTPAINLRILLEQAQQSDAQFEAVAAILRAADRARGPDRHPIEVTQCELRYVYLTLAHAYDPRARPEDIEAAVRASLGLVGDDANARSGVFGLRHRRLGEREYALRIEGAVQNVPGITWCRVVHFGLLAAADDPEILAVPTTPALAAQVICGPTEMLQLHPLHLTLTPSANV